MKFCLKCFQLQVCSLFLDLVDFHAFHRVLLVQIPRRLVHGDYLLDLLQAQHELDLLAYPFRPSRKQHHRRP